MNRRRHGVLMPDPSSEHQAVANDAALLLADLVRSWRAGDRAWVLAPFASPSVCAVCDDAYRAANYIIAEAGGAAAWVASFEARSAETCEEA